LDLIDSCASVTSEAARASKKGMLMYVRELRVGKFPRVKGEGLVGAVYGADLRAPECSCKGQG